MSAKYTWTEFQREVLRTINDADRAAPDFFVRPPITIDCRGDIEAFSHNVNIAGLIERHETTPLRIVNDLRGAARKYAQEKLSAAYRELDADAKAQLTAFLRGWMAESGRQFGQAQKPQGHQDIGVEIALPVAGMRLQYDIANASGVI